jgi:hypothetical protein
MGLQSGKGQTMWLHNRDERSLIAGYHARLGEVDREEWFRESSWLPVLTARDAPGAGRGVPAYGSEGEQNALDWSDIPGVKQKIKEFSVLGKRLRVANQNLEKRGLVRIRAHQHEQSVFGVSLTLKGYDLGRKYSRWFTRTGELFHAYRNHWIIFVLGFFAGILGSILVTWLSSLF